MPNSLQIGANPVRAAAPTIAAMFATHLTCFRCGARHAFDAAAYLCPACADRKDTDPGILDVHYDYAAAGAALKKHLRPSPQGEGRRDVFRWRKLLPLADPADVLPAGNTALVEAPRLAQRLGLARLLLKDETRNPTRCLKDRATAVGVSMALGLGRRDVYCASAGNAAISLAGFAAHARLRCHVFVPSYASATRLDWLRRFGADVRVSTGNYDQAFEESEAAGQRHGWWSRNCACNPFLVEGKKTCAFEIAEQLEWRPPDMVVAPVGDGCTLAALGKGARELRTMGLIDRLPRLVGAQSAAVQPLVERFAAANAPGNIGASFSAPSASSPPVVPSRGANRAGQLKPAPIQTTSGPAATDTQAASMAVRRPRNALRLFAELREAGGTLLAVTDDEIAIAQRLLAAEAGLVAEFTSAATLAALLRLRESESLAGKTAVLVITGGRID